MSKITTTTDDQRRLSDSAKTKCFGLLWFSLLLGLCAIPCLVRLWFFPDSGFGGFVEGMGGFVILFWAFLAGVAFSATGLWLSGWKSKLGYLSLAVNVVPFSIVAWFFIDLMFV
jgi:hypothetical protein